MNENHNHGPHEGFREHHGHGSHGGGFGGHHGHGHHGGGFGGHHHGHHGPPRHGGCLTLIIGIILIPAIIVLLFIVLL